MTPNFFTYILFNNGVGDNESSSIKTDIDLHIDDLILELVWHFNSMYKKLHSFVLDYHLYFKKKEKKKECWVWQVDTIGGGEGRARLLNQ